jgi:thiamine biosynthesis lipoprotein
MSSFHRCAFPVMGTFASISIAVSVDRQRARVAIQRCRDSLEADERRFSHFDSGSEISRSLRREVIAAEAQQEIDEVMRACRSLEEESGGVFRATDPRTGRIDTAGYVKGYAIRKAAEAIRNEGVHDFLLSVGGDTTCSGAPNQRRPWRVAVADPLRPRAIAALLEVHDGAVATAGVTQRGEHIWRSGDHGSSDQLSWTVTGPDIALADAFSTIGFAMGPKGISWVNGHQGYASLVVMRDGSLTGDSMLLRAS